MNGNLDGRRWRLIGMRTIVLTLALLLTACGGSSEDVSRPIIQPAPGPAPAPGTVPIDDDGGGNLDNPLPAGWSDGPIFINSAELVVAESFPLQVSIKISAELPTPCNEPYWQIADDGTTLDVTVFTGVNPAAICIQVIQPIEFSIDLGDWDEARDVLLNGESLGGF